MRAIARVVALAASIAIVVGALGPWATYTPFHVFDEPARETSYGFDGSGVLALLAGAIAAYVVAFGPPRNRRLAVGLLCYGFALANGAFALLWINFMRLDTVVHWGLPVLIVGSIVGLLASLVQMDRTRAVRRTVAAV